MKRELCLQHSAPNFLLWRQLPYLPFSKLKVKIASLSGAAAAMERFAKELHLTAVERSISRGSLLPFDSSKESLKKWELSFTNSQLASPLLHANIRVLNRAPLYATPWTVAQQAPLSMGFPRQEYHCGLPFPSPGIEPSLHCLLHCRRNCRASVIKIKTKSLTKISESSSCIGFFCFHILRLWRYTFYPLLVSN